MRQIAVFSALACAALLTACSSKVLVPPRIPLSQWSQIGIVDFESASEPELAALATRQFVEMLQDAQPGSRIVELGGERRVLAQVGHGELDFEAVRAVGAHYGVDAVFAGDFQIGEPRPSLRVGRALTTMKAQADITGRLDARLLETRSGATVWSRSSRASADVARVGISKGLPTFGATDPARVHGTLTRQLVVNLGGDFYATWQRQ